jgi:glycerol-3-phosphate acyltransferase PlsY
MSTAIWVIAGLGLGTLPFSYWVGHLFAGKDIRDFGDGNPGATNVFNAGGPVLYILAILLDAFKAALPVWLAQALSQLAGWQLALVAIAPLAGNIFSPFMHFRGGTGVAVVYGVWLALTGWVGPVVIAASFGLLFIFIRETPWCVIIGMLLFTLFVLAMEYPLPYAGVSLGHTAMMGYRRRMHFIHWPKMQQWLSRTGGKRSPQPPMGT